MLLWPDVELGLSTKTGDSIKIPGRDRALNSIILGSIGTGKAAALTLPIINQDFQWIKRYVNDLSTIDENDNNNTNEQDLKNCLNGVSIIESSNEICGTALKLVHAHGIPEEKITYINPLDPKTASINPMKGPAEHVYESISKLIEGCIEKGEDFALEIQKMHLKYYIYLLKLHNPEKEVTFDMLLDMYNHPKSVRKMHEDLKEIAVPADYEFLDNEEQRQHWLIIKQLDQWFDENLVLKTGISQEGSTTDEIEYYDLKAEYVIGIRNSLNTIGSNKHMRRVLFGNSSFDFDEHLEAGGILLLNTNKEELMGFSNALGNVILMNLQHAIFRRDPRSATSFHHIIVNEMPEILGDTFSELTFQSRKVKAIVTVTLRSITQLINIYGEHYTAMLIGSLRNRIVYGEVNERDSKYFNSYVIGGENWISHHTFTKASSPTCSVSLMSNGQSMPIEQIKVKFIKEQALHKDKVLI
ncbi:MULTISPECIES: type IV secretion system DNA-binding domain-containing protein [Metabacillus]|uniref:type IV secretion system DNA-binding domain-containing protein n=1 Tax=Metabacillus TaxID=2675233 RepID=UPI000C80747A|nr:MULTISPECIES: type IV secretion system DNA-binding domain-containing protein [Metabacillus]MCM3443588.1 type IV secretion system DNA-binding domain-containing protein [Metabacillus halosaccharovorans]PMC34252.1 hypothetical protein CJ195_24350 [Bacillus sp. UMB0899]